MLPHFFVKCLIFFFRPAVFCTTARVPADSPAPAAAAAAAPPGAKTSPVLPCSLSRSFLFTYNTKFYIFFYVSSPTSEPYPLKAMVISGVLFSVQYQCFSAGLVLRLN